MIELADSGKTVRGADCRLQPGHAPVRRLNDVKTGARTRQQIEDREV